MAEATQCARDERSFAERLSELFETARNPETGRRFTYAEVVAGIAKRAQELPPHLAEGRAVSEQYVGQLLKGVRTNPTLRRMEALADFFGVPTDYFTSTQAPTAAVAMGEAAEVEDIAFRARGLSPGALRSVRALLDHARQLEGLDPVDDGEPS